MTACPCGSGLPRSELVDARGIFCCFYCDRCDAEKRSQFRPEIFTDSNYEADDLGDDYEDEDDEPEWDDDSDAAFERYYQSTLVDRKCQGCGRHFMGRPDHGFCDSCADIIERGGELPNAYD